MITVRPMAEADLPATVALIQALAAHHGDDPGVSEATLARDALGPDPWVHVHLAEVQGQIAGYMALKRLAWLHYGDRGLEIYHLFVAPEHRRSGIGRALIARAKDEACRLGCVELKVGTHPENRAAMDYYLSQGFAGQELTGARFRLYL